MIQSLSLPLQTIYAELLERCSMDEMAGAFAQPGAFVSKQVRGRRYWYFQKSADRKQFYVGPESDELLRRIEAWRLSKGEARERREIVAALRRAGVPGPDAATGKVLKALAEGGVFRLRALLVGTLAYQTYAPILGLKLPGATLRTGDIDIAQLHEISIALDDAAPPPLELLRQADPTFRAAPSLTRKAASFVSSTGLRVEFLAPKRRAEDRVWLKALNTYAQALPYLEFLLREPVRAVVLSGAGVLAQVPDPIRYACHKLVIARMRRNEVKGRKDLAQAALLIEHLLGADARHLGGKLSEFAAGGRQRRKLVIEGLRQLPAPLAERLQKEFKVS
jgi:hypothetical protein